MRTLAIVRVALSVLLAGAVFASCGFGADQPTGRVGETLTAGDYQLTVSTVENPADRPDRFTNPKPGNRFVKVHVVVANAGSQHLPFAANYFSLRDSGGIDNPAMPNVPSDNPPRPSSIAPGQQTEHDLYFEMAANLSPTQLVFAPSVVGWRTRITVNL
ncbi:MAG TPA: DUF4352 domain-containing protein [Chloroflexota bacterium]|nr:DUF4352 domain-containing protein [Chloroflexota bacterium]